MSPPTLLGLRAARSAGAVTVLARTRSRKPGANRSIWPSIAAVMSPGQEFGTWAYTQNTWDPAGARDGSNRLGWEVMRNGGSGAIPRWADRRAAPISAIDAPR
jgi:hypothetical protein